MMHANELPLRHLINKLDRVTQGPKGFSGIIGRALMTCELLPVVKFEPIILENCPNLDVEVSIVPQYLYELCQAISAGTCSPDLAARRPRTCHTLKVAHHREPYPSTLDLCWQ